MSETTFTADVTITRLACKECRFEKQIKTEQEAKEFHLAHVDHFLEITGVITSPEPYVGREITYCSKTLRMAQ